MNRFPAYEMDEKWKPFLESSKQLLAKMIDARPDELAMVRNTTEAIESIMVGLKLERKSELVLAYHDYGALGSALENKSREEGLKLKKIDIQLPCSDQEIIDAYADAITENTSLVVITAMTHREGQILPGHRNIKISQGKRSLGFGRCCTQYWTVSTFCSGLEL